MVRQVTCLAIWVAFALARVADSLDIDGRLAGVAAAVAYGVPAVVLVAGLWLGLSDRESALVRRFFDRGRSGDEQGFVAVARRS